MPEPETERPAYTEEQKQEFQTLVNHYKSDKFNKESLAEAKSGIQAKLRQFRNKSYKMKKQVNNEKSPIQPEDRQKWLDENIVDYKSNKKNMAAIWQAQRDLGYEKTPKPARRVPQSRGPKTAQSRMAADINLLSKMPSYLRPFKN